MKNIKETRKGKTDKKRKQFRLATALAIFGMVLLMAGFATAPTGTIDSSVLVATGEVFTFSASLIGIEMKEKTLPPP